MVIRSVGITGGTGLLGRHFIKFLLKKKIQIFATYRNQIPFQNKNISWIKTDLSKLTKSKNIIKYFSNIDFLILNAATTRISKYKKDYNQDIESTRKLSKWCLKKKIPLAYISGSIVYKNRKKYVNEKNLFSTNPTGKFYGLSKINSEKIIEKNRKKGLKAIIIRPTSIYGYGQNKFKLIFRIKDNLKNKIPVKIYKSQEKINLIHASDVVKAVYKLYIKKKFGIFNISFRKNYSLAEIVKIISKIYGIKTYKEYINKKKKIKHIQYKLNNNKIYRSINWLPKVSLEKGIKLIKNNKYI